MDYLPKRVERIKGDARMLENDPFKYLKHPATPCHATRGVISLVHSLRLMHPTAERRSACYH